MNKITFACTACGRQMSVPESAAGKSGNCKTCNTALTVPYESTAIAKTGKTEIVKPQPQTIRAPRPTQPVEYVERVPPPAPVAPPPIHIQMSPQFHQTTQVVVHAHSQSRVGCLAVLSVIFGLSALVVSWVPLLGLLAIPGAGFGVLLGFIAIVMAAINRDSLATGFAGVVLSGLAIAVSIMSTAGAVALTNQAQQEAANRRAVESNAKPITPTVITQKQQPSEPVVATPTEDSDTLGESEQATVIQEPVVDDSAGKAAKAAKNLLDQAKTFIRTNNKSSAVKRLKRIVDEFGNTPSATEAKELLEKHGS